MRESDIEDFVLGQGLMRLVEEARGGDLRPECEAQCSRLDVDYTTDGALHCRGVSEAYGPDGECERISPWCKGCPCYDPEPEWLA